MAAVSAAYAAASNAVSATTVAPSFTVSAITPAVRSGVNNHPAAAAAPPRDISDEIGVCKRHVLVVGTADDVECLDCCDIFVGNGPLILLLFLVLIVAAAWRIRILLLFCTCDVNCGVESSA